MSLAGHPLSYLFGIDCRALSGQYSEFFRGRIRYSDLSYPGATRLQSVMRPDVCAPFGAVPCNMQRAFVLTTAPIATDALGQTFPAGTVFVCWMNQSVSGLLRAPGNTSATITGAYANTAARTTVYHASKIPAGAVGTITIKNGAAVVSTLVIDGADGEWQIAVFPAFTTATTYSLSWSGGVPLAENINVQADEATLTFWAVPDTLPAAFTARFAADDDRGGTFGYRNHADPTRTLSGPNQTYETLGLALAAGVSSVDLAYGCLDLGTTGPYVTAVVEWLGIKVYNAWIDQQLRSIGWAPMAKNAGVFTVVHPGWTAVTGFVGTTISITTPGMRYLEVNGSTIAGASLYSKFTADPLVGDTVTFTIKQDGVVLSTLVYVGAAIKAIPKTVIAATMPAHGTQTVFTIAVAYAGFAAGIPPWHVGLQINGSPRCDIPFATSIVGPGNACAPGGYLASALGTPVNGQPPHYLAAGVTSYTVPITVPLTLSFLPAADGWQKVVYNGADLIGIGENYFGHTNRSNVQRGHTGRRFWCKISPPGGATHNAVLTSYAPPLTGVGSAFTTLDMTIAAHLHWAWGSFTTSGARDYIISVALFDILELKNGIRVELSQTDSTVLTYDRQVVLETFDELYVDTSIQPAMVYKGTSNTPPGSPASGDAWGTLAAPTGVWAANPNQIAIYDGFSATWIFIVPRVGSYMIFDATHFAVWTGTAWVTATGIAVWTIVYSVTGANIYMAFSSFSTERSTTPGKISVSVV